MKNKLLLITITLAVMINLVGCGINQQSNTIKNKVENVTEQTKNDLVKIPKDLKGKWAPALFMCQLQLEPLKMVKLQLYI